MSHKNLFLTVLCWSVDIYGICLLSKYIFGWDRIISLSSLLLFLLAPPTCPSSTLPPSSFKLVVSFYYYCYMHIYACMYNNRNKYNLLSTLCCVCMCVHGSFSKEDRMLKHKANLNKYRKTETIPCVLFDHYTIKLKINSNKSLVSVCKCINSWRLNNSLLNGIMDGF